MKVPHVWRSIRHVFHIKRGERYHTENSIRGVRKAKRLGYDAIDIDLQMTAPCKPTDPHYCGNPKCEGHVVATHWDYPIDKDGFTDPLHRLGKRARVRRLTLSQVLRLIAPGRYRILPVEKMLAACHRYGVKAVLEPKGDPRFEDVAVWQHIAQMADDLGCHLAGYSIRDLGGPGAGERRVAAMRAAGIDAHVIEAKK